MATAVSRSRYALLRHPIRVAVGIMLALGALQALLKVHEILLLGFLAVLVAVVFSFPVNLMSRVLPRGVAVLLTLAALAGAIFGLVELAVPVLSKQAQDLAERIPEELRHVRDWAESLRRSKTVRQIPQGTKVAERVQTKAGEVAGAAVTRAPAAAVGLAGGVATALLLVVMAAFLVASPHSYRLGVRALVPREYEEVFDEGWRRLSKALRKWVGGISVAMLAMGLFTGAGLALAGIQGWLVLGLLTGLATFVPYAGAIASAIPGLLVALSQSPRHLLYASLVYAAVHLVEGYLVEPFVMKRAVEVRPALLLFGQALLGALFGPMGIVVATPLLVCGQELVGYLWVERRLGKAAPPGAVV